MRGYSAIAMDHFQSPRNAGRMDDANAVGRANVAGRAPYMTIYLKLKDEVVERATFQTFGCGAAIAAGSMLTEMVKGKSISACETLAEADIDDALGGLPPQKRFCAALALLALHDALKQLPTEE